MNYELFRRYRKENGYSLKEAAVNAGCDLSHLSKIERGERTPSIELLEQLSSMYQIGPSTFFEETSVNPNEVVISNYERWKTFTKRMDKEGITPDMLSDMLRAIQTLKAFKA